MNEPLAENRYTLTKDLFFEGMKRVSKENYAKFARNITLVVIGAWILMAVLTFALGQGLSPLLVELLITAAVLLWIDLYLPWDKRRRAWKKLSDENGEVSQRSIRFDEGSLTIRTELRELTIPYTDVKTTLESGNLYILLTESGTGIMIGKQGFIRGSWPEIASCFPEMK